MTSFNLSVITIGEMMDGLTSMPLGKRRERIRVWIDDVMRPWFAGRVLLIDEAIAERWGVLAGEGRIKGRPVGVADGYIAATALQHDLIVVTRNARHFAGLGVGVLNPWTE
jgi:toxin FitB